MVFGSGGAEGLTRVETARRRTHRAVEVMHRHELAQVGAAHVFTPFAECVREVEIIDTELVGDGGVAIIGHAAGDPMVAADSFDVPNLVYVRNDYAVRFVGAISFKQLAQPNDAFTSGGDIWQHEGDDVLFADAARLFGLIIGAVGLANGRLELDHRVRSKHALVDGDGFGGAHCHIVFIGTGLGQHTTIVQHIGSDGVTAGIVRQVDFDVTEHTAVVARLVFRGDGNETLGIVTAGA